MRRSSAHFIYILVFFVFFFFKDSAWAVGNWIDASGGYAHTIALKNDRRVFAAGYNNVGQLGDGTYVQSGNFKQVATGVTDVAAYGVVSYILKSDGTVWKTSSTTTTERR